MLTLTGLTETGLNLYSASWYDSNLSTHKIQIIFSYSTIIVHFHLFVFKYFLQLTYTMLKSSININCLFQEFEHIMTKGKINLEEKRKKNKVTFSNLLTLISDWKIKERQQDEQAKSFVNSTTGLKNSRLSMF